MKYLLLFSITAMIFIGCGSNASDQDTSTTQPEAQEQENPETSKTSQGPYLDIDVDQFKKMMSQPDVVLLDVRTPEETAEGKIEGAIEINVNASDFKEKIMDLDKSKSYLVYCAAGARSATTCENMASLGFSKLYNLEGGYGAWVDAQ